MSRSRAAVVWKTWFELLDQVRELALAAAEGAQGDGAVAEQLTHREPAGCRGCGRACRIRVKVVSSSPKAAERSWPRPWIAIASVLHPFLEGGPGARVEGAEDLVDLDRLGDVGGRQRAAVLELRAVAVAGRQFDVGLGEQRLGAQDRPRVLRDRRVLVVDVDRRDRQLAGLAFDALDFADVDAGDPHVRLLGELGRLVEGDRDLVGLRLERRRPAEGDPEEEQDPEAGQGEAGDHEELASCWGRACSFVPGPQLIDGVLGSAGIAGSWSVRGMRTAWRIVLRYGLAGWRRRRRGEVPLQVIIDQAALDRAAGVGDVVGGVEVVVDPGQVEEVALLRPSA